MQEALILGGKKKKKRSLEGIKTLFSYHSALKGFAGLLLFRLMKKAPQIHLADQV